MTNLLTIKVDDVPPATELADVLTMKRARINVADIRVKRMMVIGNLCSPVAPLDCAEKIGMYAHLCYSLAD